MDAVVEGIPNREEVGYQAPGEQVVVSDGKASVPRLVISLVLTVAVLAVAVTANLAMGMPEHIGAIMAGEALFRPTDFCFAPLAFLPFMGFAAALHIMGIWTGDKSIMKKRAFRYPVRILALALIVGGDAWLAHAFVVYNEIFGAAWIAFVGVVTVLAYWWLLRRSQVNESVMLAALDEDPLLDALILSLGFFAQAIAANGLALILCLFLLPRLIRFVKCSTFFMLWQK